MFCWYCYWGWPKLVRDIYDRAEKDVTEFLQNYPCEANGWEYCLAVYSAEQALKYGPAHIVWSDENWDCTDFCIEECSNKELFGDWPQGVLDIIKRSLQELAALPDEQKYVEPSNYDGWHPENYPPPANVQMVKK